jgi:hypothetical protein
VRQEVAVLVDRAVLDRQVLPPKCHKAGLQPRSAVDDHEFRSLQAAGIKIVEIPYWGSARITTVVN